MYGKFEDFPCNSALFGLFWVGNITTPVFGRFFLFIAQGSFFFSLFRAVHLSRRWKLYAKAKEQALQWKNNNSWFYQSGQIIATSHDLTPNGGLVREIPLFQGYPGW